MGTDELRARWSIATIKQINREIMVSGKNAVRGSTLPPSPFGTLPSGRADYRGFALTEAVKYARLAATDFSGTVCQAAGAFIDCVIDNCVFDGLEIQGRFVGKQLTSCSFVMARMRSARPGELFTDCDFSAADLSHAITSEVKFTRCNFAQADLRRAILQYCRFEDCLFAETRFHYGSLVGSVFRGPAPSRDQLGNTMLDHVTFGAT